MLIYIKKLLSVDADTIKILITEFGGELTEMIQILMMTLLGLKVQMSLETVGG